ncbi:MAG TPA: hypothetical protein VMU51_34745 [Mycobacteriales bacterium]|nr:hypothetical protein [Mycobacteriales bacterium]
MKPHEVPAGPLLVDTDVFSFLRLGKGRHADFAALIDGHVLAMSFAVTNNLRDFRAIAAEAPGLTIVHPDS